MRADAYLRIDDFPSTGYEYALSGRSKDADRAQRLKAVIRATADHGVIPEVMVCTHVMDRAGRIYGIDEAYPRTVSLMRRFATDGKLVVNAHGMLHLREKVYLESGRLDPQEFLGLDERETARKLDAMCEFIVRVFGKVPRGFVAPAWGYEPGITKPVAARYFDYIADSYDSWQAGAALPFGTVDPVDGYVHFPETWRYGPHSVERADPELWARTIRSGTSVHLMQHGTRIPGEWRRILEQGLIRVYGRYPGQWAVRVMLPRQRPNFGSWLVATGTGITAGLLGFTVMPEVVAATLAAAVTSALAPPLARLGDTREIIRKLQRANLASILAAAAAAGVRWGTLEELAIQIKRSHARPARASGSSETEA